MIFAAQKPIISTHRGRRVVLSRRHVSAPVLGIARVRSTELLESFPRASDERDWIEAARVACNGQFGMMGNDVRGCCTISDGPGHCSQVWSANTGTMVTPTDAAVLKAYGTVDGYVDGDPSTDNGGIETNVLAQWVKGIDGFEKIELWLPINPQNLEHLLTGIERYGCVYSGVALPLSAQDQPIWELDETDPARAAPASWGGHAVSWSKYSRPKRMLGTITWGMEQGASFSWTGGYCDEAYVMLCTALWCRNGTSPLGDPVTVLRGNIGSLA